MIISYYAGYRLHRPYIANISTWVVIVPRYSLLTYGNWLMWLDKDSVSASKSTGKPGHSAGR